MRNRLPAKVERALQEIRQAFEGEGASRPTPPTGEMGSGLCDCWVSRQSADYRFAIRYGAHNPECPGYRPSLDPVDNYHDAELRMRHERD